MAYINKRKVELALKGAQDLMRIYESNTLSERYIAAKAAAEAFQHVLELCGEELEDISIQTPDMTEEQRKANLEEFGKYRRKMKGRDE